MITFLEGKVVEKHPTRVVLNVGGVGYEVFIPLSSFEQLPAVDSTCRLEIYDHIREDTHDLFGFGSSAEREMFVLLLSISGIGPKLALSALSGMSVREISDSIVNGDVGRLHSISGVGKKTAERMVVELRDKLADGAGSAVAIPGDTPSGGEGKLRDAIMALISLGYKQADAEKMVRYVSGALDTSDTVEDVVRKALVR